MSFIQRDGVGEQGKAGHQASERPDRRLAQPFSGWTHERMNSSINAFIEESELEDYQDYIRRGAFLAQSKAAFENDRNDGLILKESERQALELEHSTRRIDKFKQPWRLYALVACCSLAAAVQGWDETAVNGAQIYYKHAFHLKNDDWSLGLVASAPYLCCAFSCWLNYPMNKLLDRRGVIFITCLISSFTCLGQAFPQTWKQLFAARFLLGFGIGPKSATVPIYAAEAAPANIRGALVMMWQMWTAFGIMCGLITGVVLAGVREGSNPNICGNNSGSANLLSSKCSLNWRLMLASPMILPLFVAAYIYTLPESPRWLLMKARKGNKKKYEAAFMALVKLRHTKLQAGRDLFLINHLLEGEEEIMKQQNPFKEIISVKRNRRALTASVITMFMQQFCGVNVTAYYSSSILVERAHFTDRNALLISMGFGIINFLFALPAVWTIDSFGRRNLLLSTFPFMAFFQILMVIAFTLKTGSVAQNALVILGMYLFGVAYSPGEGPVPFVYSAESMPLYNRDFGMGIVTSINWFWNFFIGFTWPGFLSKFTAPGAYGWYAAWCVIGWWMILLFVRETKDLTLEQLDQVFEYPTKDHMRHGLDQLKWFVGRYFMGRKSLKKPVFLHKEGPDEVIITRERGFEEVQVEEKPDRIMEFS
ncbi:MFS sugar transporter [Zopfia rhizophila CBS 207.26]|uniref:MFS sugar transporter n=1 Tax=Zopfia rhizophila CBS 207.26 TaxID=1314779 RepID=A0A6A6DBT7_9PEZI|nr:MFS sugar transporter [Zopfia rhizophila CBS 207.26]